MKAIVKYGDLPGQVDFRDIPEPVCTDTDIKIEVQACAVCMTDLHFITGNYPWKTDIPLGHEFCGVVTATGKHVRKFKRGDRVAAWMDGGFAEFTVKDENDWVFPLPDEISFLEGALLEPLAAAINGVFNRSYILPADHVLIEGPGVIGLFALQAAKQLGASVMVAGTDSDVERLRMAEELKADRIVNVQKEDIRAAANEFTNGHGIDTVLECSGSQSALDTGLQVLKYDGQLTQLGILGKMATVDLGQLVYNNRRIVGSIAYDRAAWLRGIELVRRGSINVKSLISEVLPLTQWEYGFDRTAQRTGYRTVLVPDRFYSSKYAL